MWLLRGWSIRDLLILFFLKGQEMLVWYGDSYLQFLGIPVSLKEMNDEMDDDTSESNFIFRNKC